MKSTSAQISTLVLSLTVITACADKAKNASAPQVAIFDYFRYEGKDTWFEQEIDPGTHYFNPVIAGFYPDPSICRKGATYYLVTSSFGFFPGVPVFSSKDLVNWEQIGHVLDRTSQLDLTGRGISEGIFAPAIEYNPHNDTFYMITTGVGTGGNFFVKTKDPSKGWSDPVPLPGVKGIDPSFLFDEDGKGYIVHNDEPENEPDWEQQRAIRIHEFDTGNDCTTGRNREIIRGGVNPKDKPIWIEAPHLYKVDGYYYLMCAEGGTGDQHSEVIFRAGEPFGPYEPAAYNPILTQRDLPDEREYKITNAGHADLVQTPEGDWWAVFLACRPYEENTFNTGRETFLLPVSWTDGFPVILPKGEQIPVIVEKNNLNPAAGHLTGNFVYNQEFDEKEPDYSWMFIRTPQKDFFAAGNGKLHITAMDVSIEERKSPAALMRRQQHTSFSAETQLEYNPKTGNDFAGLTLFQNEEYQFLFGKTIIDGKENLALYRLEGNKEMLAAVILDGKGAASPIRLRVEGKGRYYDFLYSTGGDEWKTIAAGADAINLSTGRAKGFVGACIGLYATTKHLNK